MTDNTQELDEILAAKFATKPDGGAWCTIHSHRLEVGVCRSCEAKQAILDWHNKQVEKATDSLLEMVSEIEFKAGISHVTMSGEWVHIDEVNKQIEEVLDRIEASIDSIEANTYIDGFHSDVRELQDHIEAERNKLKRRINGTPN